MHHADLYENAAVIGRGNLQRTLQLVAVFRTGNADGRAQRRRLNERRILDFLLDTRNDRFAVFFNLLTRKPYEVQHRIARAAQQQQEWSAALRHDDIVREEMNGWTALVQSRAQVDASEESLRIAGENLSISTYSYGEGLATILDVLQAQLSWIQLYSNAIRAHYNYAVAVSDYQRITAQ